MSKDHKYFCLDLFPHKTNDLDLLTSNNEHDRSLGKISKYFAFNRTQSSCNNCFLNILQKYYQPHILGTLDMYGYFHQKQ